MTLSLLASLWGYVVLFIAWNMADDPRLGNYLQLAIPFTIPLLGALSISTLLRMLSLWIAAGGTSLVIALLIFSGLGLLIIPVLVVYLWTAWKLNEFRRQDTLM